MTPVSAASQELAGVSGVLRELRLPTGVLSLLLAHAAAVTQDADRLGLVSGRDTSSILSRHTADSLLFALVRRPEPGERWVDVGSGAGFPGLVLACCFPLTSFMLVEPQQRRAGFLDLCVTTLGLENTAVSKTRAVDMTTAFDVAVTRALAEPALALETMSHLLLPGGLAMLAAGETARVPVGAMEVSCPRPGADSPGRFFVLDRSAGGA